VAASDYTGTWAVLYDWQAAIAGGTALIAGGLAFWAGVKQAKETRRSAQIEAAATAEQTAALKQQNADLRRAERRRLARESLTAARLLAASLEMTSDEVEKARSSFTLGSPPQIIDASFIQQIVVSKPRFSADLWARAGILNREILSPLLNLEAQIDQMHSHQSTGVRADFLAAQLNSLSVIVRSLCELAADDEKKAVTILSEEELLP
jgi:hypothetical protein